MWGSREILFIVQYYYSFLAAAVCLLFLCLLFVKLVSLETSTATYTNSVILLSDPVVLYFHFCLKTGVPTHFPVAVGMHQVWVEYSWWPEWFCFFFCFDNILWLSNDVLEWTFLVSKMLHFPLCCMKCSKKKDKAFESWKLSWFDHS